MEEDHLEVITNIIMHSGDAKSLGMEAIQAAKSGKFWEADQKMAAADNEMVAVHQSQTELLKKEASGKTFQITLLMIHAQDHLMNAITFLDLAKEMIDIYRKGIDPGRRT